MDAVELPYPVDVAASKLMVSEGFGRVGVTVEDAEARDSGSAPILVNRTERCCSLTSQKDGTSCTHSSESVMLDKIPDTELFRNSSKLPNFLDEHVSEQVHCRGSNYLPCTTRPEGAQLHQKSTKITNINSSMRQGITQLESKSLGGCDDVKDIPDRLESYPSKCSSSGIISFHKTQAIPVLLTLVWPCMIELAGVCAHNVLSNGSRTVLLKFKDVDMNKCANMCFHKFIYSFILIQHSTLTFHLDVRDLNRHKVLDPWKGGIRSTLINLDVYLSILMKRMDNIRFSFLRCLVPLSYVVNDVDFSYSARFWSII